MATSIQMGLQQVFIGLSQAVTLTANVLDQYGRVMPLSVTWSSGNTNAATINASTGAVTPVAYGSSAMTATYGLLTGTTTVAVLQPTALIIVQAPPTAVFSGSAFATQPTIQLQGAGGQNVGEAGQQVTASIASGTATLSGTTTVATDASGLATFVDLALTGSGTVQLRYTTATLTVTGSTMAFA